MARTARIEQTFCDFFWRTGVRKLGLGRRFFVTTHGVEKNNEKFFWNLYERMINNFCQNGVDIFWKNIWGMNCYVSAELLLGCLIGGMMILLE